MFEKLLINVVFPKKKIFIFSIGGLILLGLVDFILLSYAITQRGTLYLDLAITQNLQSFSNLTLPMVLISGFGQIGVTVSLFAIVIGFLYLKGYSKEATFFPLVLAAPVLNLVLKELVARPRPTEQLVSVFEPLPQYSYPSSHVMFYVVFFGFLAFLAASLPKLEPRWRFIWLTVSLPLIILVGLSRVYLGAHWPSDILGAYLFGGITLLILILIYLKYVYRLPEVRNK